MTINEKGETQKFRSETMAGMIKDEYFNIFQGRLDCYGVRSRENFAIREKDQKHKADHWMVKEPLTTEVWRQHFDGTLSAYNPNTKRKELCSLGVYQIVEGKCFFGTIDLDEYGGAIDHKKLAKQIALLKLPLVVSQSASLGAHLHLLLNEWTDVDAVRKTLKQMSDALDLGETEIFPRDNKGDFGYFMNQQYWKGCEDPAFSDSGEVMSYKEFVMHCKEKTTSPNILPIYNLASLSKKVFN